MVKFMKFYLLKIVYWLWQNYYVHKTNLIIVTSSLKQCGAQITKVRINKFFQNICELGKGI